MDESVWEVAARSSRPARFAKGLSEIVLIVEDVGRSAAFYKDVVGLSPMAEPNDSWAWFWAGRPGQSQHLAVHKGSLGYEEESPHSGGPSWGQIHYAFEVESVDLESAVEHVRSCGVSVYGPEQHEWMGARAYYFYDPDGNLVEFWTR